MAGCGLSRSTPRHPAVIIFAINAGLLIWVATSYRKLKHDVLVALLFGSIKAGVVVAFSIGAVARVGLMPVVFGGLISGLFSFFMCWGFMALLGRTDRINFEHRRAVANGERRKKPALVLEWVGIAITGIACLFF